jgi:multidrug efflux pump
MCSLFSLLGIWTANQNLLGFLTGSQNGANLDINVFTQIGFVVLIGLACKNAILIVEFAKLRRDDGEDVYHAILEACRLRLRPILMTSFAFILGVLPLVIAEGAGWEMRRALGTAVFSGMLGVTLFGVFLTPVFFLEVDRLTHAHPFSSQQARWVGALGMDILKLGFLLRPARRAFAYVSEVTKHNRKR